MNKFVDRNTQFPNRKILDIKSVTRNNVGEIETLCVEEIRAEGEIYQEGTPLNASTMNRIIEEVTKEEVNKKFEEGSNEVRQLIEEEKENIVENIVPQLIRKERDRLLELFYSTSQIIELDKSKIELPSSPYFDFELPKKGLLDTSFEWGVKAGTGITIEDYRAIVKRNETNQNVTLELTATNKEEVEYEEFHILVPSIQYAPNCIESSLTFSVLADGSSSSIDTTTIEVEENLCLVIENEYEYLFEVQADVDTNNMLTIQVLGKANLEACGISQFNFTVRVDNKITGLTHQIIHGVVEYIGSIYPED